MELALFCKTFRDDVNRLCRLLDTIERYNIDHLPVVISAPRADHQCIRSTIGSNRVLLLADEDILRRDLGTRGWYEQQIVKFNFALTGIADNYAIIDADHYIVREFSRSDFLATDGSPYLISSLFPFIAGRVDDADEMLAEIAVGREIGARGSTISIIEETRPPAAVEVRLSAEMIEPGVPLRFLIPKIKELMQRPGPLLHFMPGPIWSAKAVRALKEQVLDPSGIDFTALIDISPWEADWYANWVLTSRCIEVLPKVPLFFHFPTDDLIIRAREMGITNTVLARSFLGVALAARHQELLSL